VNEERATGLILRLRPLTETSLIVHWLTPELGRLATVAKGARRAKSPLRGKLDLFHLAEFTFMRSRRSELHTLREAVLHQTHPALRRDIARLEQAAYGVAFIEMATETETPLPMVFQLFQQWLAHLDQHPPEPLPLLSFELRLLEEFGFSARAANPKLNPGTMRILEQALELPWGALSTLKPSAGQIRELNRFLCAFIAQQLGQLPRGRARLSEEFIPRAAPAP
jgi:DNA repair protein RecO (recombination protein O)